MQLRPNSCIKQMTGSNSLKMLISKKIQADLGYFEVKVTACLQEKENLLQNLQKGLEVKDAIIEGLDEKLEEVRTYMQAYVLDCTKKDEVIKDLKERVMEYRLTNSKKEQEINVCNVLSSFSWFCYSVMFSLARL